MHKKNFSLPILNNRGNFHIHEKRQWHFDFFLVSVKVMPVTPLLSGVLVHRIFFAYFVRFEEAGVSSASRRTFNLPAMASNVIVTRMAF